MLTAVNKKREQVCHTFKVWHTYYPSGYGLRAIIMAVRYDKRFYYH